MPPQPERASRAFPFAQALSLSVLLATLAAAAWLFGYARSVAPFAWDYLREGEFDFLTFPGIKLYHWVDEATGAVSLHLDFFSVADGPTGVEYTEWYFPCWPVSLGALASLLGGGWYLLAGHGKSRINHSNASR